MCRTSLVLAAALAAGVTAPLHAQAAQRGAKPAASPATKNPAPAAAARPPAPAVDTGAGGPARPSRPTHRGLSSRVANALERRTGVTDTELTGAASGAAKLAGVAVELNPTVKLARAMKSAADRQKQQELEAAALAAADAQRESATETLELLSAVETRAASAMPRGGPGVAASGDDVDAELRALQARQMRLLSRAAAGDTAAASGMMRMQLEMADFAARAPSLPPDQQAPAAAAAMRGALVCAETGRGCRHPR